MSELGRRALTVLRDADEALAGSGCPGTAECCYIGVTGLQPNLTEAEWQVIADELERQGREVPAPPEDGACAFLTDRRCSIYPARPLGCRTYYCHRGGPRISQRAWVDLRRRLEVIASPEGDSGRLLSVWLNRARRRR